MGRTKVAAKSRFGRLLVVRQLEKRKNYRIYWVCICDCGNQAEVSTSGLIGDPGTKSCGCLQKEAVQAQKGVPRKHGMTKSSEYCAWQQMKVRCLNNNSPAWRNYGGRGIKIYTPWVRSFEKFFAEVGPKPSPRHSLDRIDPDGDYKPGNVRWSTPKQQRNNRSSNLPVRKKAAGKWFWRGRLRE